MSEVLTLKKSINITLKSAGFLTDSGDFVDGLYDREKAEKEDEVFLRHGRILDENQHEAKIDLIYETPATLKGRAGHSCIYFKDIEGISKEQIKQIRKDVWNTGRAPILWLISPTEVRIYDAFARPQEEDTEDTHILDVLEITSEGLKDVEQFRRELFDTGKFWESGVGRQIDPNQRVEKSLLDDLWDTEQKLTRGDSDRVPVHIAHALLGRAIFMAYLWDRKIITPEFLKANFEHGDIKDLLTDREQLDNFFQWLRITFNGDLFPLYKEDEKKIRDDKPYKIIRAFFDGTVMSGIEFDDNNNIKGQKRLWPYSFDIIPIELISSIYEMFAHSKDPIDARAKSIHYTKFHLVELVQSIAMLDLSDDARILDPACGSGVFLVDAFRRLVLKRSRKLGRKLSHDEILQIFLNQIYGVDVEPGAVEVTAFSLYLALLELDENFTNPEVIKFPKLIYHPQWEEDYYPPLYIQDICNSEHIFNRNEPFKSLKFDLIVGNLPWTKLGEDTAPCDPENPALGKQWALDYCKKKKIYRNRPDQAIMIRVKDFAKPKTKIAFIISSRIFYQQKKASDNFWLNSFLTENFVELVFNLSDLSDSKILFGDKKGRGGSTGMPGSVFIYRPHAPEMNSCITYICPKWYSGIKRREDIIIHSSDIQTISTDLLIENPHLWKIAFRGTQRDFELIQKLYKNFTLKNVLKQIGIPDNQYGQGYEHGSVYDESNFHEYFLLPNLEEDKNFKYCVDSEILPIFSYRKLGRKRSIELFRGPLLIFRRSLIENETRVAFTPHDTIFSGIFIGISFYNKGEQIAHRINAVLNTKLGIYFAFLLGDSFGWHFKLIEQKDWLNVPLPKSILDLEDNRWNEVIAIENKLCESWKSASSSEIKGLEDSLFKSVCDLYELTKEERIIVEDMINYTIDHFLNRKKKKSRLRSIRSPTLKQLEKYANRLCEQLNDLLALEGKKVIYQLYELEDKSPSLTLVEFRQTSQRAKQADEPKKVKGIEEALIKLSENVKNEISGGVYAWGHLRVYEGERLYIIKPSEERFWSESSALNDADEIIREHMENRDGKL